MKIRVRAVSRLEAIGARFFGGAWYWLERDKKSRNPAVHVTRAALRDGRMKR